MSRVYMYDKYVCDNTTLMTTLEKYGVAIIPNLLDNNEIKSLNDGIWNYLEYASSNLDVSIKRNKPNTWKTYFEYFAEKGMLLQKYGIGHAEHLWKLRENPKIIKVFETIYNTYDLSVSFDGCSFGIPYETTKIKPSNEKWFHTDQSYDRNDFEAIQSWLTGYSVDEGDATLGFLENSHKFHENCKKEFSLEENDEFYYEDYYQLSNEQLKWYIEEKKCQEYYIKCPVGSMVLWDSRTIHFGASALEKRNKPNFRNVAYICMQPKYLISKDTQKQRKRAFDEIKTTSHWVTKCAIFRDYPIDFRHIKNKILKPKIPILTDLGRKLI